MIVLTVKSFNGVPSDGLVASFDELGGTIGRADTNQLVLPDPERTISRIHAQVVFRNGSYAVIDRGSNPVVLNGQPLGAGREMAIGDGDELLVGGYRIAVSYGHKTTTRDPFDDLFGQPAAPAAKPLAKPVAKPASNPMPRTETPRTIPSAYHRASAPPGPGGSAIPDDWDPFAPDAPGGGPLGAGNRPATPGGSPYIPDLPMAAPSREDSLDALFGLGSGTPAADPLGHTPMGAPVVQPNTAADADPLRAFGITPAPVEASRPDHGSELNTPWTAAPLGPAAAPPPAPALPPGAVLSWDKPSRESMAVRPAAAPGTRPASAPPATPAPRRAAAAGPVPDDALLRAFLDGLGMPNLALGTLDEERMRLVGLLLREATRGAIELLVARASLKREMRAQVTMIVAKENNPLKFSPSVEVALQHLLGAPVAGFMPPADALRDAFDDLRAHQLGVMAGMRAALEGVLRRFDPAVLEGRIEKRSALADLLPGSRKARLWELYQQLFSQLSEEAADEFHELFGKAFLRAYDAQIAQLRGE